MAKEDIAQTYAQAIFDEAIQGWQDTLKSISTSLTHAGLTEQLDNPATPFGKKEELLRGILPANAKTETQNFIKLLASKNHVHLLPQIIAGFDRRAKRGPQQQAALVTSAIELSSAEKQNLESKLRAKFGADVAFEYTVNTEILGGVIVRVGDKVIDGSVSGKIAALKEKLTS
jgi:F-type H+-transporting ATPase subunit delta